MGSVNANGISVVDKQNLTFRNRGGRQIVKSDSRADVETTIVSSPPARTEGSIVNGLYMGGRSASARVASKPGVTRDLDVELGDNKTIATVPEALQGTTAMKSVKHTGAKVVVSNSHDDTKVRESDAGSLTNH
jgi:hypothetical protein